ncbi:MAG: pilus assembly protein TadG-related protein [Pseudomonadota bacterium]
MSAFNLKSALKSGAAYLEDVYGGAAIIMALMTPVIIGGLAFGAEVGGWELTKRQLQNAADTAAFAAATQVRSGRELDVITAAAVAVAEVSGYDGDEDGVLVESPPATAPNAVDGTNPNGRANYVYVTLTQTADRNFTKFFAADSTVTFRSAALVNVENGRPACVLSLAPNTSGAVTATGSTTVSLSGCDVASNSISPTAVTVSGSADLTTDCVSAVGGVSASSGLHMTECSEAIENAPLTADPYRNVAAPSVPGSCATGVEKNKLLTGPHGTGNPKPTSGGVSNLGSAYCGGGNIQGTTNLSAGVYVLNGGIWRVNAGAKLLGSGVTLYLTGGATLDINGGAEVDLSAPTSGTYAGLLVFFDRANTGSSTINGGSDFSMVGAVYGAKQNISFSGDTTGGSAGQCTQVIGYTVQFAGNSGFDTDCSASGTKAIMASQSIKIVG